MQSLHHLKSYLDVKTVMTTWNSQLMLNKLFNEYISILILFYVFLLASVFCRTSRDATRVSDETSCRLEVVIKTKIYDLFASSLPGA